MGDGTADGLTPAASCFRFPTTDTVDFKYCFARAADGPLGPGRLMTLADNALMIQMREAFADPYRTVIVSRATTRHEKIQTSPSA